MNLQLATALSCTNLGCRVQYINSGLQVDADYSQLPADTIERIGPTRLDEVVLLITDVVEALQDK